MFMKFDSKGFHNLTEHEGMGESAKNPAKIAHRAAGDKSTASEDSPRSTKSVSNEPEFKEKSGKADDGSAFQSRESSKAPVSAFQNEKPENNNTGILQLASHGRSTAKSKTGCLTCKYRKKKCDETKPVCRDCRRFDKECVWVDHRTMNGDEIERLKLRVREQESSRKMRKRARLPKLSLSERQAALSPSSSPELPLDPDGHAHNPSVISPYHAIFGTHSRSSLRNSALTSRSFADAHSDLHKASVSGTRHEAVGHSMKLEPEDRTRLPGHIDDQNMRTHKGLLSEYPRTLSPNGVPHGQVPETAAKIDPNLAANIGNNISTNIGANIDTHVDSHDVLSPFQHVIESDPSPPVFNFLKEWSSLNLNHLNNFNNLSTSNNPMSLDAPEQNHSQVDSFQNPSDAKEDSGFKPEHETSLSRLSPNFSISNFLEQMHNINYESPAQLTNLASAFNATFSPGPQISLSLLPELDQSGLYLYNYYSDVLSSKICIAPNSQNDSNSYQRVFLPLAQKDKGVLYGILAWAGFHLGGNWLVEGSKYAELALKHLCEDVDFSSGSQTIEDRRTMIHKLATILIMCGAEICRGDVKFWSVYLEWGWKLLRDNGGILNFNNNKEEHWLISNFAYHDLLASSTSDRGTYFPNQIYDRIFLDPDGISNGNLNPLLGVSKPLYKVIGDISSLFFESKQIMSDYYNRNASIPKVSEVLVTTPEDDGPLVAFTDAASEISDHTKVADLLNFISNKAHGLEITLNNAKPNASDLRTLSDHELELQLTTFEAFQLSCKLYLRQAILKLNPSALECQILMNDLVKCLDILIDTPMQATLVFPLFMAGIFTVKESGKTAMRDRYDRLIHGYGPWNVVRVKSLVENIWRENPHGDRVVDWNAMLNNLNWDLNFA